MRALGITVASAVLGTGLVAREARLTAVLIHLNEVEGTVDATRQVGDVDREGELFVLELEHLVVVVILQHVEAGADIGRVLTRGDEVEPQAVSIGDDTVRVDHLIRGNAVEGAVLGTSYGVRAEAGIPLGACVAVLVAADTMGPAPVGVESDALLRLLAATRDGAGSETERWVHLCFLVADLLGRYKAE